MANDKNMIAAQFQALPLEYLVAAPLIAAVKAQKVAAETTKAFIEGMIDEKTKKPITVDFEMDQVSGDDPPNTITVNAPLLAMVPVPHLRIDSLTTQFHFEISQTFRSAKETSGSIETTVKSGRALSPWVSASLKGNASSKSSQESNTNRSGSLDITVQASEAAIPEGLARVLSLMTSAIQTPNKGTPPPK